MVEQLEDMPPGTVGFRAGGQVTREDYRQLLEPALREAVEAGEVRMLYVVESDFEMDGGAVFEDAKTALTLGAGHLSAWKRTARHRRRVGSAGDPAVRVDGAGEVKVWGLDGLSEAREWVAG
jgi:SpoIIAA-like